MRFAQTRQSNKAWIRFRHFCQVALYSTTSSKYRANPSNPETTRFKRGWKVVGVFLKPNTMSVYSRSTVCGMRCQRYVPVTLKQVRRVHKWNQPDPHSLTFLNHLELPHLPLIYKSALQSLDSLEKPLFSPAHGHQGPSPQVWRIPLFHCPDLSSR